MESYTIYYSTKSSKALIRQNRFQLLGASFSIIIGYLESFQFYTSLSAVIPVIGLVVAFCNITFAAFYEKLTKKYGNKFEMLLLRTDGLIMLITGIGYDLAGSDLVPVAYYMLTLMYFVVLPYLLLPAKAKRYFIQIGPSGISLRGMLMRLQLKWGDIEFITLQNDLLTLKRLGRRKVYKCFIREYEAGFSQILEFIKKVETRNHFNLRIEES